MLQARLKELEAQRPAAPTPAPGSAAAGGASSSAPPHAEYVPPAPLSSELKEAMDQLLRQREAAMAAEATAAAAQPQWLADELLLSMMAKDAILDPIRTGVLSHSVPDGAPITFSPK